jgi:SAM-dependent methyltransferase
VSGRAKTLFKTVAGSLLEVLRPDLARAIDAPIVGGQTMTGQVSRSGWQTRARKWILEARIERARWRQDHAAIRKTLADFWRSDALNFFYDRYRDRFTRSFLGPHHVIVDEMDKLVQSGHFTSLIEIGCGDGQVLNHCAGALPSLRSLTGLDINPTIIAANGVTWQDNPRLRFVCGDAMDCVGSLIEDGTILLTYGGVMEYLDRESLVSIFETLARHQNVAVAMVEPLSPEHDLTQQRASFTYGVENSFSHNYPHLLASAGFKTAFQREVFWDGVRWLMMLAANEKEDRNGNHGV